MTSRAIVLSDEAPDGHPVISLIAGRIYERRGGRLVASEEPWEAHYDAFSAAYRPATDVVLRGSAHSHRGPVTRLSTQLRIGPVCKRVDVTGDRSLCVGGDGTLTETSPNPFETMPLTYERAYGGRDEQGESLLHREGILAYGTLAYPRNPDGRGYLFDVERKRLDGSPLPNLYDPDDPVTLARLLAADEGDWIDRPVAATYDAIGADVFPRVLHSPLGVWFSRNTRPIREVVTGVITEGDLDVDVRATRNARAFSAAAPGLGATRLSGDEPISLWNLHTEGEHVTFRLPGDVPRMLLEPPNTRAFELEPKLATVLIEPELDRVTLTWAGALRTAAVFPSDICAQMNQAVTWN